MGRGPDFHSAAVLSDLSEPESPSSLLRPGGEGRGGAGRGATRTGLPCREDDHPAGPAHRRRPSGI